LSGFTTRRLHRKGRLDGQKNDQERKLMSRGCGFERKKRTGWFSYEKKIFGEQNRRESARFPMEVGGGKEGHFAFEKGKKY